MVAQVDTARIEALWADIPLARAARIELAALDDRGIVLRAPFAVNRNHMQTGFAGSLLTLGTLAGWALTQTLLDAPADVVLQASDARFLHPVRGELLARCARPGADAVARFRSAIAGRGRARIDLKAEIHQADRLAFEFTGRYVALRRDK